MSNKTKSIIYGLAIVAAMINSVISFNNGDKETSLAWFCASGMAAGAFIAYSELNKKTNMNIWEIREAIAESGKLKVSEVCYYFKIKYPNADIKTVKSEAKEMISEAKKFNKI